MRYYSGPFLLGILPRLLQIGFTFAQSFLVDATTTWVGELDEPKSSGYGLIGAFAIVYMGIAVSNIVNSFSSTSLTLIL